MEAFWIGRRQPPAGVSLVCAAEVAELPQDALVFVDDQCFIKWADLGGRRTYLVTDLPLSEPLPEHLAGVIPYDGAVLETIRLLCSEMRESYDIGDLLIRSLNEKERTIQEKQAILLRDSQRYHAIIKYASDLVALLDDGGRITDCNETMLNSLAQPGQDLIGAELVELVAESDREALQALIRRNFEQGVPCKAEVCFKLASGRSGIFSLMSNPLIEEGRIYAVSIIGRDITDLRNLQALLTVQAGDLTGMINGLAHELRNPLTVIGAYIRRFQLDEGSERQKRAIEGVMASIKRIEDMVNRIERYKSIASMECYFAELDVRQLVLDLMASLKPVVALDVAPSDLRLVTDREHLKIALRRVLENAIESGTDQVQVTIDSERGQALIRVRDYGAGIRTTENIFAPFSSTDPLKVGLGLTEARLAMVKIGGEVELEPDVAPGASFVFRLPLDRRQLRR
ncbi:MAG: Sporulation kinase E [Deltaproteobacteria bacterium ADurb.Bin510]|nr:MAG: Sporulation kinase E [Deltaproteobacteria bacterium ADurb.Bin510]